ncbi:MAG: conjugal transfer protein TraG N-terminal domain-containing protein, partial [Candidatus Tectomicrobia bacterium]
MVREIHTYGGGEFLVDILRGVVLVVGDSNYESLLRLVIILAFAWVLLNMAFKSQWMQSVHWYLAVFLLIGVLLVPKETVVVIDRIDPSLPANVIDDVPLGLSFFGSLTSRVGDWLTRASEAAYSLPDDMLYSRNGTLFASRLVQDASEFQITNSDFAESMRSFVQQCVFYDLLLGVYTLEELQNSPDIWGFVAQRASPLRAFFLNNEILPCDEGAMVLWEQWTPELDRAATLFGVRMFPNAPDPDSAKQLLLSSLPVSYEYLIKASRGAYDLLQQNMMINALHDGIRSHAAVSDAPAALAAYRDARANSVAVANYQAIGVQAQKWVPMLRIVFEGIYIGAFTIVFLLFLLPNGLSVLKVYFGGFIWLASWGPLYAILNRISNGRAAEWSLGASVMPSESGFTTGLTLATQPGIVAVQSDIAAMAGYMAMSIPFLSYAIAKGGVGSFTHMAGSMLAPVHRATGTAADEITTGNISLGNTQQDNHSFDTVSGYNLRTNPFAQSGEVSMRQTQSGGMLTQLGDGRAVYDGSGAISHGLPMHIGMTDRISTAYTEQARTSLEQSEQVSARATEARQSAHSDIVSLAMDASHQRQLGQGIQVSDNASIQESFGTISNFTRSVSEQLGISHDDASRLSASLSAKGGGSIFGMGLSV